eukprot:g40979.t1
MQGPRSEGWKLESLQKTPGILPLPLPPSPQTYKDLPHNVPSAIDHVATVASPADATDLVTDTGHVTYDAANHAAAATTHTADDTASIADTEGAADAAYIKDATANATPAANIKDHVVTIALPADATDLVTSSDNTDDDTVDTDDPSTLTLPLPTTPLMLTHPLLTMKRDTDAPPANDNTDADAPSANHTTDADVPSTDDTTNPDAPSADNTTNANVASHAADFADEVTNSAPIPSSNPATSFTPSASPKPCRIFTIPRDIPLTEDKWSVLSKGLTFIRLRLQINEYRSHLDFEHYFCHLRLCTYFFNCESNPLPQIPSPASNTHHPPGHDLKASYLPSTSSSPTATKGVATGTHMGPSYACLLIGYVEQSLFCNYTGTMPNLFFRYIDDCIGTASCSHEELEQFINFTNTFHLNLKFTWTISDTTLSFLDLSDSIS